MATRDKQQLRVDIDPELYERLKILAVKERTTLRALVTEAIEALLQKREEGRT